jgi:hypothetical protein
VAAKWTANSPLLMVDQYVPNLKRYRAIAIEVGTRDPFLNLNTQLDQALTRLGVQQNSKTYDGDHGSRSRLALPKTCCPSSPRTSRPRNTSSRGIQSSQSALSCYL